MNFDEAEKKDPNTTNPVMLQRTLIYFDTDAMYANFRGHPLSKTTLKNRHLHNRYDEGDDQI